MNLPDPAEVSQMPVQTLAYIGDAVYELFVRQLVLSKHRAKPGRLHSLSIQYAKAVYQAAAALRILDLLTETEKNILLRGRNADPGTIAKNASPQEYRWASGLESLLGYLHLSGEHERLEELLLLIVEEGKDHASGQ
ncbi:Mini-ribonuclease 3 [Trichococcus flocculiformis]|nr:ribonuclease III domain-containing protein [Trichococcus flocculiformis]